MSPHFAFFRFSSTVLCVFSLCFVGNLAASHYCQFFMEWSNLGTYGCSSNQSNLKRDLYADLNLKWAWYVGGLNFVLQKEIKENGVKDNKPRGQLLVMRRGSYRPHAWSTCFLVEDVKYTAITWLPELSGVKMATDTLKLSTLSTQTQSCVDKVAPCTLIESAYITLLVYC